MYKPKTKWHHGSFPATIEFWIEFKIQVWGIQIVEILTLHFCQRKPAKFDKQSYSCEPQLLGEILNNYIFFLNLIFLFHSTHILLSLTFQIFCNSQRRKMLDSLRLSSSPTPAPRSSHQGMATEEEMSAAATRS